MNPLARARPSLPPGARSRAALGLTAAAALGRFKLQVCGACGAVQYPPREACHRCWSGALRWRDQPGTGELIAETTVHHSIDPYFQERVPWRLGMVRLDAGPTAIVHLHVACAPPPCRVRVSARLDKSGQGVLLAFPIDEVPNMAADPQLRDMTCDPKLRKVLVTDGQSAVGQALVRALIEAGAERVWVGYVEPRKQPTGAAHLKFADLKALPQVTLLPLDVTDAPSVKKAAAEIGGEVDILINTAEAHRAHGVAAHGTGSAGDVEAARAEMDHNYFGLLRLAQEFGPVMRSRGVDLSGANALPSANAASGEGAASTTAAQSATAWVNLLSVYALSNFPPHGTFSASKAAALSLSQCLRAEMLAVGVRVLNVFPGPIDDEWNRLLPPPKLTPVALAKAVINALSEGVEDVFPGDVAQEWLARWEESPKSLEREIGAGLT